MPTKGYKPEEVVAKLRQVDVLTSQGQGVAEAIRSIGVSEVTYASRRSTRSPLKVPSQTRSGRATPRSVAS
jgi:putative transposase